MRRIFGKKGPVLQDKNVGRNWLKGHSRHEPHQGSREQERRARQMAKLAERTGHVCSERNIGT